MKKHDKGVKPNKICLIEIWNTKNKTQMKDCIYRL